MPGSGTWPALAGKLDDRLFALGLGIVAVLALVFVRLECGPFSYFQF